MVFSAQHSLEDNWALRELAKTLHRRLQQLYTSGRALRTGTKTTILIHKDKNPNTAGLKQLVPDLAKPLERARRGDRLRAKKVNLRDRARWTRRRPVTKPDKVEHEAAERALALATETVSDDRIARRRRSPEAAESRFTRVVVGGSERART